MPRPGPIWRWTGKLAVNPASGAPEPAVRRVDWAEPAGGCPGWLTPAAAERTSPAGLALPDGAPAPCAPPEAGLVLPEAGRVPPAAGLADGADASRRVTGWLAAVRVSRPGADRLDPGQLAAARAASAVSVSTASAAPGVASAHWTGGA